ncbi:ATP-binding protein [Cognatilysobacter bugurensis]|uniref:histidine kinase n=1 Tax=Cognatilysobacter bugurensis TaxID=543356 RepID=A0A918T330_9GAMM|nr:ATP-binding protein [Lysobacter bugurensis]GHA89269.1 sensor histidine kinase [Lysobacter bugurensis]
MSHSTTSPQHPVWSEDLLWALSVFDAAVLLVDGDLHITHANPAAHALAAKVDPDRPEPESLLARLPRDAWQPGSGVGRWRSDIAIGDAIVLQASAYCGLRHGEMRRFIVIEDVSERIARERELTSRHDELERTYRRLASTQEQLLQTEKMASIGQLAAGVAHEINNPIGYVHSNLGTLRDYTGALISLVEAYGREIGDEHQAAPQLQQVRERLDIDFIVGDLPQLLDESREGIERVTKIVQDLKEFSHVGRDEPMRPVDLHKGLDSTLNIVWNDLKYKVRLEKHYGELPNVECHASEINQVFMNLLINAGQSIAERGTITVATGTDGDEAWISIADSGCGIPDESLARIFDPFYTTKPIGRGTGLGLAICYGIIAKHHGRIEVSSRLGFGSTFKIVLPVKQPRLESADA